jgi:hypothetical protein
VNFEFQVLAEAWAGDMDLDTRPLSARASKKDHMLSNVHPFLESICSNKIINQLQSAKSCKDVG